MIGKLLRLAAASCVCFALGTVLAQALLLAHLWQQGRLTSDAIVKIMAIASGVDLAAIRSQAESEREQDLGTQVSPDDVARARALASFDIQLREESLRNAVQRAKFEQTRLGGEQQHFTQVHKAFQRELEKIRDGAAEGGQETARLVLENMDPAQAKGQVLLMIKSGEIQQVVALLSNMQAGKRKKIVDEFQTEDETLKLAEILELIRKGVPEAPLADEATKQLQQPLSSAN